MYFDDETYSDIEEMSVEDDHDEVESDTSSNDVMINNNDDDENDHTLLLDVCSVIVALVATDLSFSTIGALPGRIGNEHRDRELAIVECRSWDDTMFKRQFRLSRRAYNSLITKIYPALEGNVARAVASSGSAVSPELMLLITLRMLAGASYLDMIWFKVCIDHVTKYVVKVCKVINNLIGNIEFPNSEIKLRELERGWKVRIKKKYPLVGSDIMDGVVAAGDGIAIKIKEPKEKEIPNDSPKIYFNRKGFHAIIAQAFCDSYCRFIYFQAGWPGSTNDVSAYDQTLLNIQIVAKHFPEWIRLLADEAYSSFGGILYTPFSIHQLTYAKNNNNMELYLQMRAFNHVLSSLRIHIERAFGMLIRRWGILWKEMELKLENVVTILMSCVRLHNWCIDDWLVDHDSTDTMNIDGSIQLLGTGVDLQMADEEGVALELLTNQNDRNEEEMNQNVRAAAFNPNTDLRVIEMHKIRLNGIVIDEEGLVGLPGTN